MSCPRSLVLVGWVVVLSLAARAQCALVAAPGQGVPGIYGEVLSQALWDPDGAGPLGTHLVAIGPFAVAGNAAVHNVAMRDLATGQWSALGTNLDLDPALYKLGVVVLTTGELVAYGGLVLGNSAVCGAARWTGSTWAQLGAAPTVADLALSPTGDPITLHSFFGTCSLRRWNGTSWTTLANASVGSSNFGEAVAILPNGDVIVGGKFSSIAGVAAANVARWNGTQWFPLGAGLSDRVFTLRVMPNGDLLAGGTFLGSGVGSGSVPMTGIARWDGSSWSAVGSGMGFVPVIGGVRALAPLANGDVVAGGSFLACGATLTNNIARWDGNTWHPMGNGVLSEAILSRVMTVTELPNGDVAAGGSFGWSGSQVMVGVARWNGNAWSRLADGTAAPVHTTLALPDGDVVAGGAFRMIGGVEASYIARRVNGVWQPLGTGTNATVASLAELPNGDVVAGGAFTTAGGVPADRVARWDGAQWHAMGAGFDNSVAKVVTMPDGSVVAIGSFTTSGATACSYVARWTGSSWVPLGSGLGGAGAALGALPNGDVVAGGAFGSPGPYLAKWNGTSWSPLPGSPAPVTAIAVLPDGSFVTNWRHWNGATSTPLGSGISGNARVLMALPGGDILAGGPLTIGGTPASLARFDGTTWTALAAGTAPVEAASLLQNGELVLGGTFATLNDDATSFLASWSPTCPATAAALGQGCPGASGPVGLVPVAGAWLGSVARSLASGLPPSSVAIAVAGFDVLGIALPPVLAPTAPSCLLWTTPVELVLVVTSAAGEADLARAIPALPALSGLSWTDQIVGLPTSAGSITGMTSSNGVRWTIGDL